MIKELKIENFRGFASLELKDLTRVNLVVGENNAGKTSLLEAFLLLCEPSRAGQLPGLFGLIAEVHRSRSQLQVEVDRLPLQLTYLEFHDLSLRCGRHAVNEGSF